jgi:hypothetical protein
MALTHPPRGCERRSTLSSHQNICNKLKEVFDMDPSTPMSRGFCQHFMTGFERLDAPAGGIEKTE